MSSLCVLMSCDQQESLKFHVSYEDQLIIFTGMMMMMIMRMLMMKMKMLMIVMMMTVTLMMVVTDQYELVEASKLFVDL